VQEGEKTKDLLEIINAEVRAIKEEK